MITRFNKFDESQVQTSSAELAAAPSFDRSTPGQRSHAEQLIPINLIERALLQHEHVDKARRMVSAARRKQPAFFASMRSPTANERGELSERNNSSPQFGVTNLSHSVDESQSLTLPARQQRDTSQSYSESDQKDSPYKIFCPCGVALTPAEEERLKCLNSIAVRQHEEEEEAVRQVRLAAPPDRRGHRLNVPPKRELRVPRLYRIALEDLRRDTAVQVLVPPTLVELPAGTFLPERAGQRFARVLCQTSTQTPPTPEPERALRMRFLSEPLTRQ